MFFLNRFQLLKPINALLILGSIPITSMFAQSDSFSIYKPNEPIAGHEIQSSPFPKIIHTMVEEDLNFKSQVKLELKKAGSSNSSPQGQLDVIRLIKALTLIESKEFASARTELSKISLEFSKADGLGPLFELAKLKSNDKSKKPLDVVKELKDHKVKVDGGGQWKPEFYEVLIQALIQSGSTKYVVETWSEYESQVKPAQKSEKLALNTAKFLQKVKPLPGDAYWDVVESIASYYPYAESARVAFHHLQSMYCRSGIKYNYRPSQRFLARLVGNSAEDEGLKKMVSAWASGEIRSASGSNKSLDDFERASLLFQLRLYDDAEAFVKRQLENLSASVSGPRLILKARYQSLLGQIYSRTQRWELTLAVYSKYSQDYEGILDLKQAKESIADALSRLKSYKAAAAIYAELSASLNSDPVLRWHTFWNLYLGGDFVAAKARLDSGKVPLRDKGIDGGLEYWNAKILEKLGKSEESNQSYRQVLKVRGDSIYSFLIQLLKPDLRLAVKAGAERQSDSSTSTHTVSDEPMLEEGLSAKLLQQTGQGLPNNIAKSPVLGRNSPELIENSVLDQAKQLILYGESRLARRLIKHPTVMGSIRTRADYDRVKNVFYDASFFGFGMRVARLIDSPLRQVPDDAAEFQRHVVSNSDAWKDYYPISFERLVNTYADAAGIDRYLLLSIMRSESIYEPDARSHVGARGLMQIMPFTAQRIARLMGDYTFEMDRLHEPEVNLGYAAFYLRKLLDYYKGHVVLSIAAYNAGPKMVDTWLAHYGHLSPDEFIESISFKETRTYTKNVLKNLNQYQLIYSSNQKLVKLEALPQQTADFDIF